MLGSHWIWLPRICAGVGGFDVLGAVPTVTVAVSVGSLAGGATPVRVIFVSLSTDTRNTGTALPSAAAMLTVVMGQPVSAALFLVVKPVPLMTTLS
jgi:hypothetical protein